MILRTSPKIDIRSISLDLSKYPYMESKQIEYFKARLLQEQRELQSQQDDALNILRDEERFVDPIDIASQGQDAEMQRAMHSRRTARLREIAMALTRIENEDFGYCTACGAEIGLERLILNPAASMDSSCAELNETQQKKNTGTFRPVF